MTTREWNFKSVSPAEAGDFIQITFSNDPDSTGEYVLLSTQFEFPQNYDLRVEEGGGDLYTELTESKATLTRTALTIEAFAEFNPVTLILNYDADDAKFAELVRVAKIMFPSVVCDTKAK